MAQQHLLCRHIIITKMHFKGCVETHRYSQIEKFSLVILTSVTKISSQILELISIR
jgi:hypothetical protein